MHTNMQPLSTALILHDGNDPIHVAEGTTITRLNVVYLILEDQSSIPGFS